LEHGALAIDPKAAKLRKWHAAIFPRKEQPTDNRRSMSSSALPKLLLRYAVKTDGEYERGQ
jgi:hypothetical protein